MFAQWNPELELGNAMIDTQHRMLLLLCRKLDIAIKTARSEQTIQRVILELKKFTEFHFISEQNLMHEIGYPQVAEHLQIHNSLIIELQVELSKIRHHSELPDDLLSRIYDWFKDHVVEEDLKIAEFSKTSPNRPIGEDLYRQFLGSPFTVGLD
jgi:hemerythrin